MRCLNLMDYYWQYDLRSGDTVMTCWLGWTRRLREGEAVTLKELPEMRWIITRAGTIRMDEPPVKKWNVGGL